MALTFKYSDPLGIEEPAVTVDLGTEVVRFGKLGLSQSADLGEPSVSSVEIDDPGAVYDFVGLRAFHVHETSAPSNNQVVFRGAIQERRVSRADSMLTTSARRWTVDLNDYNWHLSKRILTDSDANRPDESAGDRIRWLLASAAHFALNDYGYVTYPSDQMEANDYRGQRPIDLLADAAIESGYNFWCDYNEAHGRPELFFMAPGSSAYASDIVISNDTADDDGGVLVFYPYKDAELTRSPVRIAFGAYLAYQNGAVYVRKDSTGQQFAKVDQTAPMANVKHEARARRIATHFVNDNDEEDDQITCAIKVPARQVNDLRHGQRVLCKFTHLPGYEDFVWMRVKHRTVMQEEEGGGHRGFANDEANYRIELELTPSGPFTDEGEGEGGGGNASVRLYSEKFPAGTSGDIVRHVNWLTTGDVPQAGREHWPLVGMFAYVGTVGAYTGIQVTGTGTLTSIHLRMNTVNTTSGTQTTIVRLLLNGAEIGSDTTVHVSSGISGWVSTGTVDVAGVAVVPGDVISAEVSRSPDPGGIAPAGVGAPDHMLWIEGTLA